MDLVEQALQMLKEHPTYKDDEEIRGKIKYFVLAHNKADSAVVTDSLTMKSLQSIMFHREMLSNFQGYQ